MTDAREGRVKPPKPKIYHMAAQINDEGHVSALCFASPRKIDLSKASWSIRWVAVTCPKCLAKKPESADGGRDD